MTSYKPYVVRCSAKGCQAPALYKIAASWTDGTLVELKPYGFACEAHLEELFPTAEQKRAACRVVEGERIDPVGIYRLEPLQHDQQLTRLTEREEELAGRAEQ